MNFLSLLLLVALLLLVLRLLSLSLMVALIYSGGVIITFIFIVMTFDQSEILCIASYKFIPILVLYVEGFIPYLAYEIWQHGLLPGSTFFITNAIGKNILKTTIILMAPAIAVSAPMVQVGKDLTWHDCLILQNSVSVLDNVL